MSAGEKRRCDDGTVGIDPFLWAGLLEPEKRTALDEAAGVLALARPREDLVVYRQEWEYGEYESASSFEAWAAELNFAGAVGSGIQLAYVKYCTGGSGASWLTGVLAVHDSTMDGYAIDIATTAGGDAEVEHPATVNPSALETHIRKPLYDVGIDTSTLDDPALVSVLFTALGAEAQGRGRFTSAHSSWALAVRWFSLMGRPSSGPHLGSNFDDLTWPTIVQHPPSGGVHWPPSAQLAVQQSAEQDEFPEGYFEYLDPSDPAFDFRHGF